MSNERKTTHSNTQVPVRKLAAAKKFAEKMGGIEKAKQAVEELNRLRKSA